MSYRQTKKSLQATIYLNYCIITRYSFALLRYNKKESPSSSDAITCAVAGTSFDIPCGTIYAREGLYPSPPPMNLTNIWNATLAFLIRTDRESGIGSGSVIQVDLNGSQPATVHILTVLHVVQGFQKIENDTGQTVNIFESFNWNFETNEFFGTAISKGIKIESTDTEDDLAVVSIVTKRWSVGTVQATNDDDFFTNTDVLPGNSGGPAVNEQGDLIGVVFTGSQGSYGQLTGSVRCEVVRTFVQATFGTTTTDRIQ